LDWDWLRAANGDYDSVFFYPNREFKPDQDWPIWSFNLIYLIFLISLFFMLSQRTITYRHLTSSIQCKMRFALYLRVIKINSFDIKKIK
jgi:hypothetical protein